MRFRFDPNQDYQIKAIEAIGGLFEGQGHVRATVRFEEGTLTLAAVANQLDLPWEQVLENLRVVQERNGVQPDENLARLTGLMQTEKGEQEVSFPNFSVEMETGTGKTYIYIRTALELFQRYGMRKFIIVVPSVAVREGIIKTFQVTKEHFGRLFGNPVYRYYVYDSSNLSQVRQFAQVESVEFMVMTIDSFNKASNVIRQSRDQIQGDTPLRLIQATRPVLVLDEPQNMESEKSIAALATLNPLFALRYSATHRVPYNIVYRLTPAEAYREGLVKKIEVDAVISERDANLPYIRVEKLESARNTLRVRLKVHKALPSGDVRERAIWCKPEDALSAKTGRRNYEGYDIEELDLSADLVRFANGLELTAGQEHGADKDDIFKVQIEQTISRHLARQERLRKHGIKVLSLFFIDRVANYVEKDGVIRTLFNEAFNDLKTRYPAWRDQEAEAVQAGYFAQQRRKGGDVQWLDSSTGEAQKDVEAYDLIMKDKESLLSFPAPDDDDDARRKKQVAFIFSHSALREGWDNPNVFQICTLNQSASLVRKRQEIGRGVRLAVNQQGERIRDDRINVLTVVANDSYKEYVQGYQDEIAFEYRAEIEARYGKGIGELSKEERRKIEKEYGEGILPPPPRKAGQRKARLRKGIVLSDGFKELWSRIKHKTRYAVKIDTEALLDDVIEALDNAEVAPPRITVTKARVHVDDEGIFQALQASAATTALDLSGRYPLPNLVGLMSDLLQHTSPPVRLTRRTLLEVFKRCANKRLALDNPQEWASVAVRILKEKLAEHLINGIRYKRINEHYEMTQILAEKEVELFAKHIQRTRKTKAVYDRIPCDSKVERDFVLALEARDDVKLYFKLPHWFTVPTPVGDYNPDWALVIEETIEHGCTKDVLYLVRETKGSTNLGNLRLDESRKIHCGSRHFDALGVDYDVVTSSDEVP